MFKDLYTKANNRIDTKEPYARMMEKLEKAPKRISVVKRVEYAAALAACVCLTFVGVKVYDDRKSSDPVDSIRKITWQQTAGPAADTAADKTKDVPAIHNEQEAEPIAETDRNQKTAKEESPKVQREVKVHTPSPVPDRAETIKVPETTLQPGSVPQPTEIAAIPSEKPAEIAGAEQVSISDAVEESPETGAESSAEASASEESVPMMASIIEEEPVKNESRASGGGGGGSSSVSRKAVRNTKEVTFAEYCEYMGKELSMPDGYERMSADSMIFEVSEDGDIIEDGWVIVYEKDGMTVEINMSKDTENASHYLNTYEAGETAGVKTVTLSDGQTHNAFFIDGSVAFEINAYKMDLSELENVIAALVK